MSCLSPSLTSHQSSYSLSVQQYVVTVLCVMCMSTDNIMQISTYFQQGLLYGASYLLSSLSLRGVIVVYECNNQGRCVINLISFRNNKIYLILLKMPLAYVYSFFVSFTNVYPGTGHDPLFCLFMHGRRFRVANSTLHVFGHVKKVVHQERNHGNTTSMGITHTHGNRTHNLRWGMSVNWSATLVLTDYYTIQFFTNPYCK